MSEELIDLEDFELEENDIKYQTWLIGFTKDDEVTDFNYLIDEFGIDDEAVKCAKFFSSFENICLIKNKDPEFSIPEDVDKLLVTTEASMSHEGEEFCIDILYENTVEVER